MSQVQSSAGVTGGPVVPGTTGRSLRSRVFRSRIGRRIAALALAGGLLLTPAAETIAAPFGPDGDDTVVAAQETSTGQQIAAFALQFQGYPYVWAGNTPAGFDCSGFTQYVVRHTLGLDIGHGTAGQLQHGRAVAWGAWQPGDLVFFANTFEPGISHVGIYLGDGRMIHAENPATGVVISDITSGYYAAHYYGAIRIG